MKKEKMNFIDCLSDIADLMENIEQDMEKALRYLLQKLGLSEKN